MPKDRFHRIQYDHGSRNALLFWRALVLGNVCWHPYNRCLGYYSNYTKYLYSYLVVGFPLFAFLLMYLNRNKNHNGPVFTNEDNRIRYGFLTNGYEKKYFYW